MDGMLYLLPRDTFHRVAGAPDEWMSEAPVPAVARLPISPEDFPFLKRWWAIVRKNRWLFLAYA